jgi:hypothetical protein
MNATPPSRPLSPRQVSEKLCRDKEFITQGNELIARAHQIAEVIKKRVQTAIHQIDGTAGKDELGSSPKRSQ